MHAGTAQPHRRPHSHPPTGHRAPVAAHVLAAAKPRLYNPRHPERTLLYQTIADHFKTWYELASAGQFDGQGECDAYVGEGVAAESNWDLAAQPAPDYEVDQRINW
jgi:hypothetical protein